MKQHEWHYQVCSFNALELENASLHQMYEAQFSEVGKEYEGMSGEVCKSILTERLNSMGFSPPSLSAPKCRRNAKITLFKKTLRRETLVFGTPKRAQTQTAPKPNQKQKRNNRKQIGKH